MDPLLLFLDVMQGLAEQKLDAAKEIRERRQAQAKAHRGAPAQPRSAPRSAPRGAPPSSPRSAPAQPRSAPPSSPRSAPAQPRSSTSSTSSPRWIVASVAEALDARRARAVVVCRSRNHGDVIEVWLGELLGGVALVARARRAELDGRARVLKFEALA